MPRPSGGGATYEVRPRAKFLGGTSGAWRGGRRVNGLPSAPVRASVSGLNERRPARANAVTISGLPMKFIVVGWPSLRRGKLRLYEVTMVLGALGGLLGPPPLADAGPAGVGEDGAVDVLERLHLAVALDGGAHLLGARSDQERHRGLEAVRLGLLGHVGGAAHVLVRGVGAAADQGRRDRVREAVRGIGHLGGEPARSGARGRASAGRPRAAPASTGRGAPRGRSASPDSPRPPRRGPADADAARPAAPGRPGPWRAGRRPSARRRGTWRSWRRARPPCW